MLYIGAMVVKQSKPAGMEIIRSVESFDRAKNIFESRINLVRRERSILVKRGRNEFSLIELSSFWKFGSFSVNIWERVQSNVERIIFLN